VAAVEAFGRGVIDVVATRVPAVKIQAAFYEALGPEGAAALHATARQARRRGLIVILDGKRNDIGTTAEAYARAYLGRDADGESPWDADALTINPYLGRDGVAPFLRLAGREGKGVFILVRTSNPSAGDFQDLACDGKPVYRHVADEVVKWNAPTVGASGLGDVGAVVGATHPKELAELRAAMPGVWFLVPGYGAQGGTAADVKAAYLSNGLGAVVNSSRGVTFPFHPDDPDWEAKVVAAAKKAQAELRA